jgi:hypothetical protein
VTQAFELEQQSGTDDWTDWMDASTSVTMLPETSIVDASDAWFSISATEVPDMTGSAAAAAAARAMDTSCWMDEASTLASPNASGWMRQDTSVSGGLSRSSREANALAIAKQQLLHINAVIQEHEATEAALTTTPDQQRGSLSKPRLSQLSQSQSNSSVGRFHPGGTTKAAATKGSSGTVVGGNSSNRRASVDKKKGHMRSKIPKKAPSSKGGRGGNAEKSTGQFTVPQ